MTKNSLRVKLNNPWIQVKETKVKSTNVPVSILYSFFLSHRTLVNIILHIFLSEITEEFTLVSFF